MCLGPVLSGSHLDGSFVFDETQGVPGLSVRRMDLSLEFVVAFGRHALGRVGQVSGSVAIYEENRSIQDQPDVELRLRTEDQQTVLGLPLVLRLLGDGTLDLGEVGRLDR